MPIKEATAKQMKVIKKTKEAIRKDGGLDKGRKGEIVKEAGYGKNRQKHPEKVFNSPVIKAETKKAITMYERLEARAVKAITKKKLDESKARDLSQIAKDSRQNINGLEGIGGNNQTNIIILPSQSIDRWKDNAVDGDVVDP